MAKNLLFVIKYKFISIVFISVFNKQSLLVYNVYNNTDNTIINYNTFSRDLHGLDCCRRLYIVVYWSWKLVVDIL